MPTHPQYQELFSKIVEIRSKINTLRFSDEKSIKDALNYLLDKTSVKENVVDFYQFVDDYVDKLHARDKIGTAKKIINFINQLKKYKPRLYFDEINKSFINGFKEYKLSDYILLKSGKKKYTSQITVHTYLRTFRALYNKGVDKYDLPEINPFKNVFKDIVIVKNRKKNIYLSKESIYLLENIVVPVGWKKQEQRTLDLTMLRFYLGGVDLVDVYFAKKHQFQNGRFFLSRKKLGAKGQEFDLKVFDKAQKIIDKYWSNDDVYAFEWSKNVDYYNVFRDNLNRSFNNILNRFKIETLPYNERFTTKSVRHTFATLAKFELIDVDIIRELMGHERYDIDTIYKDKYPESVRDAAHKKIIY